jgi:hypothetical protein
MTGGVTGGTTGIATLRSKASVRLSKLVARNATDLAVSTALLMSDTASDTWDCSAVMF